MIGLRTGAATDVGRVRQNNQDSLLVGQGLFAVADGVGGHRGGEVASLTAIESMKAHFRERTLAGLVVATHEANRAVWEKARADPNLWGMGTTLTALALVTEDGEERLALVNVGDSRAYLFQQGELSQLTEDHSFVEEMVREGRLTRQQANLHPQRSLITRALGLEGAVEVDSWQLLPFSGDRILLCTDGLTNEVNNDGIASVLRRVSDTEEAAHQLVAQAKEAGGSDNITVVLVDVVDDDERAERASSALAADPPAVSSKHGADTESTSRLSPSHLRQPQIAMPANSSSAANINRPGANGAGDDVAKAPTRPRRLTWRVLAFILALTVVLLVAAAAIDWYARRTYFVGASRGEVVIFKGRPGGLLWFSPTLQERTNLAVNDVPRARADDVTAGRAVPSLAEARRYVRNLREEAQAARTSSNQTTQSPPPHTTPAPTQPGTTQPPPSGNRR